MFLSFQRFTLTPFFAPFGVVLIPFVAFGAWKKMKEMHKYSLVTTWARLRLKINGVSIVCSVRRRWNAAQYSASDSQKTPQTSASRTSYRTLILGDTDWCRRLLSINNWNWPQTEVTKLRLNRASSHTTHRRLHCGRSVLKLRLLQHWVSSVQFQHDTLLRHWQCGVSRPPYTVGFCHH